MLAWTNSSEILSTFLRNRDWLIPQERPAATHSSLPQGRPEIWPDLLLQRCRSSPIHWTGMYTPSAVANLKWNLRRTHFSNPRRSCHQTAQPLSRPSFNESFRLRTRYTASGFPHLPVLIGLTMCFFGWTMIASPMSTSLSAEKQNGSPGRRTTSIPVWMHGENKSCFPIMPILNAR